MGQVQTLETPLGNEYLNASLFPGLPPSSEMPKILDGGSKLDSLPPLPSHSSQPDLVSSGPRATAMKRNSSTGQGPRQSTLTVQASKKRLSGIGVASSHGRLYKVLGDFFLLAGRTSDALIW